MADKLSALLKDLLQPQQPVTPIQRMGDFNFPCHTFETRRAPFTPEKVQLALTSCPVNDGTPSMRVFRWEGMRSEAETKTTGVFAEHDN